MAQKISQMTEQTTASMTEAGTSDFLGGYTTTGGNANRKFSLSGLANYFLNKFKMTLGGSSQTVKSAIDALNSKTTSVKEYYNVTSAENGIKTMCNDLYGTSSYATTFGCIFSGTYSGTFIVNAVVTLTAVRFTMAYNSDMYIGQHVKSSNSLTYSKVTATQQT